MLIICFIFVIKMNVEYFIAKKIFTAKEKNNSYTKPILRIAILAIALSVAVMFISVMVMLMQLPTLEKQIPLQEFG